MECKSAWKVSHFTDCGSTSTSLALYVLKSFSVGVLPPSPFRGLHFFMTSFGSATYGCTSRFFAERAAAAACSSALVRLRAGVVVAAGFAMTPTRIPCDASCGLGGRVGGLGGRLDGHGGTFCLAILGTGEGERFECLAGFPRRCLALDFLLLPMFARACEAVSPTRGGWRWKSILTLVFHDRERYVTSRWCWRAPLVRYASEVYQ